MKKITMGMSKSSSFLLSLLLLIQCMPSTTTYAEYKDNITSDWLHQTCSVYGYQSLAAYDNAEKLQRLYQDIEQDMYEIFDSEEDYNVLETVAKGDVALAGIYVLGTYDVSLNEAQKVYEVFLADHPAIYFADDSIGVFPYGDDLMVETMIKKEFVLGNERKQYNLQIQDFCTNYANIVDSDVLFERAKAIHDQLILSISCPYEEDGTTILNNAYTQSVVGVTEGSATSTGYAKAYQMLCNLYGIENVYIRGIGQSWNMIKLDNHQYYFVDCYWDDVSDKIVFSSHTHFAVGSGTFYQTHSSDSSSVVGDEPIYPLPEVSMYRYLSPEFNGLFERISSRYAYIDFEKRTNVTGRRALYNQLLDECIRLWSENGTTFPGVNTSTGIKYLRRAYVAQDFGLNKSEAEEVYYMFMADNPLFYYVSNEFLYHEVDGKTVFYLSIWPEFSNGAIREEWNEKIRSFLQVYANCNEHDTIYEKVKAIHDELLLSMDYGYQEDGVTPLDNAFAHSIVGAVQGEGTCEAYTRAFMLLCRYCGIDALYVGGTSKSIQRNSGHAWNIIKLDDGQYYNFDCTGDDMGDNVSYKYFAVGSETFDIDHLPDTSDGVGISFQYDLPPISPKSFIPISNSTEEITETDTNESTQPTENKIDNIAGDVNGDEIFSVMDVVVFQKWLLSVPNAKLVNWKNGDLNSDEKLDVFDLCLMKRALIQQNPEFQLDSI